MLSNGKEKSGRRDQTANSFQCTVPLPRVPSAAQLLTVRQSLWKAVGVQKGAKEGRYSQLPAVCGLQVALQFNSRWRRAVEGASWDFVRAQGYPALSFCGSKVSCAFTSRKPAVLRSAEARKIIRPSPEEEASWVCRADRPRTAFEVVSIQAQMPGPVVYELLRRALPCAFPSGGEALRRALEVLGEYRRLAHHAPLSCVVQVHGCSPYFLLRWPPGGSRANPEGFRPSGQHARAVQQHLEKLLEEHVQTLPFKTYTSSPFVFGCKVEQFSPRKGLRLEPPWVCLKVYFTSKQALSWALSVFEVKKGEAPAWDWDQAWGFGPQRVAELERRFPRPSFGRHRVELLNAGVDPEVQFVTDYRASGNRCNRVSQGKYLLTPCFDGQFLAALRLDVHASYLEPEVEERTPLALKTLVFDIEVASRDGGFPSTLRDHVIQVATETVYFMTGDPTLKAYRDRTIFCLGETPAFKSADGHSVRVFDYSIRRVFLFLVVQALRATRNWLRREDCVAFQELLGAFLTGGATFPALSGVAKGIQAALEAAYAGCGLCRLEAEVTEHLPSKKRNEGRASCLRVPAGEWGSWDWQDGTLKTYTQWIGLGRAPVGGPLPNGLSTVGHQAARFLFTVAQELDQCGGSATEFRWRSEAYRRAICLAEAEMLQDLADFIRRADASVIVGHNCNLYDIPELMRAAYRLQISSAWVWSNEAKPLQVREKVFQSAASGAVKKAEVEFAGKLVAFDSLLYFKLLDKSTQLVLFNLNSVAAKFLGAKTKADMKYQDLPLYFFKGPQTRVLEAMYCMQDVDLLCEILEKRRPFPELVALMRGSGSSMNHLFNKGQMYLTNLQLLALCNQAGVGTLFTTKKKREATFAGATVIEPQRGYYTDPVVTLDFASLYPSVMLSYNICITTVVLEPKKNLAKQTRLLADQVPRLPGESAREWFLRVFRVACGGERAEACREAILGSLDDRGVPQKVSVPPAGSPDVLQFILREEFKKGLLPSNVEELMRLRKVTKAAMREAEGLKKSQLHAKQLAQKLMQNSVYGSAALIWRVVGLLITFYGRQLIEFTRKQAEELGSPLGARVIYGDTDSVFVKLDTRLLFPKKADPTQAEVVARAVQKGLFLEKEFNRLYKERLKVKHINLECEAVLMPLLLINKKRYTGLMHEVTGSGPVPRGLYSKGNVNVRGDQPKFIKDNFEDIVQTLIHCGLDQAVVATQNLAANLLQGELPLEECLLYKGIKKEFHDYKLPLPGPVALAKRQGKKPGDRVVYVLVKANSKALQSEKMESPHSLGRDCEISHHEYLYRYLMPAFSTLLAVPFTQKPNEMGQRYGDAKESAKDLDRRKKSTLKSVFQDSACSFCRCRLPLEDGFPLHLRDREQAVALEKFFAAKRQRTAASRQATLFALWPSSSFAGTKQENAEQPTRKPPSRLERMQQRSEEAWKLGSRWFLCKQCARSAAHAGPSPLAAHRLSVSLLKRKVGRRLRFFEGEATAQTTVPTSSSLHSSRRNTLTRSLVPLPESEKSEKRRKIENQLSGSDKKVLAKWVGEQAEKVAVKDRRCTECRKGTGLDPKDCGADTCGQFFSRVHARQKWVALQNFVKALDN